MDSAVAAPPLDRRLCERARRTRDARFDGLFYIAVKSTGIYCRPVCPARTAKSRNVDYYPTAAAAAAAGFRPCLRCRPEAAPGSPAHRAGNELVACGLRLIENGALDSGSVGDLAARIGVGERHLRRLFEATLGASPLDVASTRRLLFAKQLLGDTALPVTRVAHAAGFASVRRFNAAFRTGYGMAPRDVRRARARVLAPSPAHRDEIALRLPYREPYDFPALLAFFARRAIPGVESVDATHYRRSFALDGAVGSLAVAALRGESALELRVRHPKPGVLLDVATRVRRMFDLDADIGAIAAAFLRDALLAPLVRRHPGVRVPGAWDGFEIAVRAILGQQVSVAAARTLAARIVARYGEKLPTPLVPGVDALFPPAERLADADLRALGLTGARANTVRGLARAVADGTVRFRPEQTLAAFVERLCALPGIGEWTAHYIAMRALGEPDAFPAADLVLRRAAGEGAMLATRALEARSQAWRPWRAYAVLLLWRSQP